MAEGRPAPAVPGRVLITGASGFLGRALADRLRELGAEVVGVDLRPDAERGVIAGSTVDPAGWAGALAGVDAVLHTAAIVSMVAPYDRAWEVNVLGTRRVLEAAAAAGVGRVLHFSSVAAFGFDFPDGVEETYPARVTGESTYGDTKVNSEAVALAAHAAGEIDVTVIRPGDVYGPGSVWIREPLALLKAGQMVLPNRGRGIFHAVHVDDLVDGVLLALASPEAAGEILTIAAERGMPCAEYFGALADAAGKKIRFLPGAVPLGLLDVVGGAQRRLGMSSEIGSASVRFLNRPGSYSIAKARRMLGFEPRVSFADGMASSLAWARAEGLL